MQCAVLCYAVVCAYLTDEDFASAEIGVGELSHGFGGVSSTLELHQTTAFRAAAGVRDDLSL
jgi:hypothetical protein